MCTGPHAFIPAADVAKVEMRYTWDGQYVENVFHFEKTGGYDETSLDQLAQDVVEAYLAELNPLQANTLTLREVYVRDMSTEFGLESTYATAHAGQAESPPLPNNVSLAVSFRTGLSGRSNRGRMFYLGLTEGQVVNNAVQTSPLAAIVTAVTDFIDYVQTESGVQFVIVSYCSNNTWRTNAQVTPVTTILVVDPTIDSMRRRLPGRGS